MFTHLDKKKDDIFLTADHQKFTKSLDKFIKKHDVRLDDKSENHAAMLYTKIPKFEISKNIHQSGKRNTNQWYGIESKRIKNHEKLFPLMIFFGETARFIGGNFQPKYRYDLKNKILFSKGVENPVKYLKFVRDSLENCIIEGMGINCLIHYLFKQDDLNAGNCLVNEKEKYFVAIDYDHCSPAITRKYLAIDEREDINFKCITYKIGDQNKKVKIHSICGMDFVVDDEDRLLAPTFMGEMTVEDFDNLPFCRDQLATTWIFMNMFCIIESAENENAYSTKVMWDFIPRAFQFISEKYFAALISYLSEPFILNLADIHIQDSADNLEMKTDIKNIFDKKLEDMLLHSQGSIGKYFPKKSESFKEFLDEYKDNMIKAVIYHLHRFFIDNNKYQGDWSRISSEVIQRYAGLWNKIYNKPLEKNVIDELHRYAREVKQHDLDALRMAKTFFANARMHTLAKQIDNEMSRLSNNPLSIFYTSQSSEMMGNGNKLSTPSLGFSQLEYDPSRSNTAKL